MIEKWIAFIQQLFYFTEIPAGIYDIEQSEWIWGIGDEFQYVPGRDYSFNGEQLKEIRKVQDVKLLSDGDVFWWGAAAPDGRFRILFGPVVLTELSRKAAMDFQRKYSNGEVKVIPKKSVIYMAHILSFLSQEILVKRQVSFEEIIKRDRGVRKLSDEKTAYERQVYSLTNAEEKKENHSWYYLQKLKRLIADGAYRQIIDEMKDIPEQTMGVVAKNAYKQQEYMTITCICICTEAAIEAGVPTSVAYDMSDMYYQKIEGCRTVSDIQNLQITIIVDFARRVSDLKENRSVSTYVERCKDYLVRNLNRPFRLQELADYVGLEKCYLSRLFSREEHMTIQEFLREERLYAASNMLKYSDIPISQIAGYFCFCSQSHFSAAFRKKYGVTPLAYRNENQIIGF